MFFLRQLRLPDRNDREAVLHPKNKTLVKNQHAIKLVRVTTTLLRANARKRAGAEPGA